MDRKHAARASIIAVLAGLGAACATLPASPTKPTDSHATGFGESRETAIEVCMPAGQREYLSELACPSGKVPDYTRIGSFGPRHDPPAGLSEAELNALFGPIGGDQPLRPGQVDYHIVDGYKLTCGPAVHVIYLDMYHCDKPPTTVAPTGFTFRRQP